MEIFDVAGSMFHYAISFAIIISIIVFIHEFGHFYVARLCGVKIDEFSIGFGKELWGKTDKKGTRWKICLIPMGGFVKMHGDASESSTPDRDKLEAMSEEERKISFHFKPLWQKFLIVFAGPAINFIFAIIIFAGIFATYGEYKILIPPVVGGVVDGYPAQKAGLKKGDVITEINGKKIKYFDDIVNIVATSPKESILLKYQRDGVEHTVEMVTHLDQASDKFGNKAAVGRIGVESPKDAEIKQGDKSYGVIESFTRATEEVYSKSVAILKGLVQIINGTRSVKELGGPVKILEYSGHHSVGISDGLSCYINGKDHVVKKIIGDEEVSEKVMERLNKLTCDDIVINGVIIFLVFMATISTMLGLTNLLPIPMLDGGHLMFYIVEAIARRPVGEKYQEYAFKAGFAFLIGLTLYVTFNDIMSLVDRYVQS